MREDHQQAWKKTFNPFDEDLVVSPYAQYDRLRAEDPIHWSPPLRSWVLTRMEDIEAVLKDDNFVAVEASRSLADLARRAGRNYDPLIRVLDATLFFMNGVRHQQDRRTISIIMNHIPLSKLKPAIEGFALSLASKLFGRSQYDAIAEFAEPLPQYVMAHILGLTQSDVVLLSDLLAELTLVFDPVTLDVCDRANDKVARAIELLKLRIADAAGVAAQCGLSIIYDGTSGSETERLADAAATALFTYRVGSETTTGLIGLLIRTMIEQPLLLEKARENRSLAPGIVAEVLRLESNVQRAARVSREARTIDGRSIQAGDRLMLLLGAANRDPKAFVDPNNLCPARRESDLAFGEGNHFCLGASLARLEGTIALNQLLLLPPFTRAGGEKWYAGRSIRRLVRLPVRVCGAALGQIDTDD
jgi:cytochrome P450